MEQIFWRDIEDLAGNWSGLGVDVKRPCAAKPPLRLLSGDNLRMQLVLGDQTLLWGTLSRCFYGVWLIRNTLLEQLPLTLVEAIDSPTVEQHAQLAPALRLKAWSRFFIDQLRHQQPDFLYPGYWLVRGLWYQPLKLIQRQWAQEQHWNFVGGQDALSHLPEWSIRGDNLLSNQEPGAPRWVALGEAGGAVVGLHAVDRFSGRLTGRLKWWRKKAREGSLPPILLWYVSGLNAYLILDGHYRLQAALDEQVAPQFLVLSSPKLSHYRRNEEEEQKVLNALLRQSEKNNLDLSHVNQRLIYTFDDRPYHRVGSQAWAGIASNEAWVDEVTRYLTAHGMTEQLPNIIERRE